MSWKDEIIEITKNEPLAKIFKKRTMINNFEEQTEDLNSYELTKLVPSMVNGLKTKIGSSKAITNKDMIKAMKRAGYKVSDARIRKIINYIRNNALVPCLIASSKGYYIGETLKEMETYLESLMQRENAIKQVRIAIRKQISARYETENQQTLF